jgi:hypothetical protein
MMDNQYRNSRRMRILVDSGRRKEEGQQGRGH